METLDPKFLNSVTLFHSTRAGIKEVVDNTSPENKYIVIDELPNKQRATYCIHTKEGWIVYSKEYCDNETIYPSVYGILFRKLDIDQFSNASLHGMPIDDVYKILKGMDNGNLTNVDGGAINN